MVQLQVYKSTGNSTKGLEMFNNYSTVDDHHLNLRDIMIKRSKPRPVWIQPTTYTNSNNKVNIKDYPATVEGVITSTCENYVLTNQN